MRIAVVNPITGFLGNTRIDYFHYVMFHGIASRAGKTKPWIDNYMLGVHVPEQHLEIQKNAYMMSPVFAPSTCLVVSERVRESLSGVRGIGFWPVVFSKLFEVPYAAGDFGFRKEVDSEYSDEFVRRMPHDPLLVARVGPHYEILMHRYSDVCGQFESLRQVVVKTEWSCCFEPTTIAVSEQLFDGYGVLFVLGGIVLGGRALAVLEPLLDRDYLEVATADV